MKDIRIVLSPQSPSSSADATATAPTGLSSNGLSPPIGMMPFLDHSPDNSLSCELSAGVGMGAGMGAGLPTTTKPAADDILIMGSLSEIGTHEVGKWGEEESSLPLHSGSSGTSLQHSPNGAHHGEGEGSHTHIDKDWYCHDESEERGRAYLPPGSDQRVQLQSDKRNSSSQSSDGKHSSSRRNDKPASQVSLVCVCVCVCVCVVSVG